MHTLLGAPGYGSAIVEAALTLAELPFRMEDVDMAAGSAGRKRLRDLNPLNQVPTLLLPNGSVMTESAAMLLHVHDLSPGAGLLPPVGDLARPQCLRWMGVMVAAIYPTFAYGDDPARWVSGEAAQKELLANVGRHRESLWHMVEASIRPGPWFLGARFTALDIYAGVMTRWSPKRDWFAANAPKLASVAAEADKHPKLQAVWKRNFG